MTILGLSARVEITNFDAFDRVVINGLAGDDVIEASGLAAVPQLVGAGGNGDDILAGDAGDDVLLGGPGIDIPDGRTGDNIVIQ